MLVRGKGVVAAADPVAPNLRQNDLDTWIHMDRDRL
jgi:hypothetical protein